VAPQARIILEPPEGGPADHHETGASLTHPLQFLDRDLVSRWWSPVQAVPLQERYSASASNNLTARAIRSLILIDKDEPLPLRNDRLDFLRGELQSL
jgi:hypothetical protein